MKKKIFFLLTILVLMLSVATGTFAMGPSTKINTDTIDGPQPAKAPAGGYIVFMAGEPAAAYQGGIQGLSATKPAAGKKIDAKSPAVARYVDHLKAAQDAALKAAGISPDKMIYSYTIDLNGFAAQLTEAEAAALAKQPGVLRIVPDTMRYIQTDSSPKYLGLDAKAGPWKKGVDGTGVVVGVIDTGIWPEHPSFADDGKYKPPPIHISECNFGNTAWNANDAPFTCNNKLIGAYEFLDTYKLAWGLSPDEFDSARDDNGHGTHTTSTAAGNSGVAASIYGIPRGIISGMAPRAHVVMYRACADAGCYTSDLVGAIEQATVDGVDAINYSIGGGASVTGADDLAFLIAADAGVFVATSAGNSGSGAYTIGGPSSCPWVTSTGANTQERFWQGTVTLGNGAVYTGASITSGTGWYPLVDAATLGNEYCYSGSGAGNFTASVVDKIVLCKRGGNARADKSLAVDEAGGAGMVMYEASNVNNLFTDTHWVPTVHVDNTPGLAIKGYIASDANPTAMLTGGVKSAWLPNPSMVLFSSRGPNPVAEDIIKPDVTAPGIQIMAGNSPMPNRSGSEPYLYPGELFQAIAGTSMSSPHVAGVYALLKQYNPEWSAAMAKSALMTTARQNVLDNNRTSWADPFDMGAGHIYPGGKLQKGSAFEPGLAYDAGFYDYLGFLCSAGPEVFANPDATCAALASMGIPLDPSDLNYPSIGVAELAGSQTVVRTVTSVAKENGWRTYNVSVVEPDGYDIVVEPSTFRIKKGQSVTFEVHITNVSAPIGQWRFGSLTWTEKQGRYSVRSPIALRASEFDAPAELSANGASGSLSFPVKFGYTGAYTAAPHGLVPATATADNVVQDPDQEFDPNDGYSDVHTFNLSGAAFFRVKIPPEAVEADADLDVFVYNPSGQQVASSTSGGTDEQVDILLPADGAWKVYVHGWSAPGGDSDYTLYSWVVSATPGGSLNLDSAPSSAVLGEVGTVQVSWSGLANPSWNLGAVSHAGSGGLMGLTLIEVKVP